MAHASLLYITLGCAKNEVDTDRMRSLLNGAGYEEVFEAADADAVIINTCSFLASATSESIETTLRSPRMSPMASATRGSSCAAAFPLDTATSFPKSCRRLPRSSAPMRRTESSLLWTKSLASSAIRFRSFLRSSARWRAPSLRQDLRWLRSLLQLLRDSLYPRSVQLSYG